MTGIADCRMIDLSRRVSLSGSITPVEGNVDIPFSIERVYYLYDVPGGETRGGHAHRALQQLIVSVMGSFELVLDDGTARQTVRLDRAYQGLYVPRLIWRELVNFSSGGICMVLASLPYEEAEYIRDYEEFLQCKGRP
jgi:WxcM-like, C-terminal